MLATTSSTALSILSAPTTGAAIFSQLAANVRTVRVVLDKLVDQNLIYIPSDPLSPLIHIQLPDPEQLAVGSDDAGGAEGVRQEAIAMMVVDEKEIEDQERLLQEVVEEALASGGVLVTRTRRLRGQETFEARPSIKICLSASHSKKEVEKAVAGLKAALVKVLGGSGSKRR
jgi:serine palmitoyltransferase